MEGTNNNSKIELDKSLGLIVDEPSRDFPGNFFDCALQECRWFPIYPRGCLEVWDGECGIERIYDVERLKIRMLEDMVSYYHSHDVGDDDLDLISSVMCRAQDDLDGFGEPPVLLDDEYAAPLAVAYERALICLESKGVVFDVSTGAIGKCLEGRFGDGENSGSVIRSWGQLPREDDGRETYADVIPDLNAAGPYEISEQHLLSERLREVLNTLTDTERRVIDFRFGLSDGYSRTLEEVGRLFGVEREDIRMIEARALRKLRHPSRMRSLGDYRGQAELGFGIVSRLFTVSQEDIQKVKSEIRQVISKIKLRSLIYGTDNSYADDLTERERSEDAARRVEYRGCSKTVDEWSRLSHVNVRRLCALLRVNNSIDHLLDSQVAKVGDCWMYYVSAAKQKGIPRKVAETWHREGMLAQEIADHYYKEVVLKYDGRDLSMEELVEMTRLPRCELKRRLDNGWAAERVLTERMTLTDDVFCGEVDIGNVRMTIGDWMWSFGVVSDDLIPFIDHDGLYVDWSRKAVWAAVCDWLKAKCLQDVLSYDSVMEQLGSGWSWKQILARQTNGVPANRDALFVEAAGQRMRLLKWRKGYGFSEEELIAEANCAEGWNILKVQEFLRQQVLASKNRASELSKISWHGDTKTVDEWSAATGIPVAAIKSRINSRWPTEDVFGIPYPCGPVLKVEGRIYTEQMMLGRFGLSIDAMRRKLKEQESAERNAASILAVERREAEKVRRDFEEREMSWTVFCARDLTMAGETLSVAQWMECLNVPRERFNGGDVREILGRDAVVRGVLRSASKCSTNEAILSAVAKWREGGER